jgi:hypothetical protein
MEKGEDPKPEVSKPSQSLLQGELPQLPLPPASPATELLRDANAGASILHKACESGWWEWSQGSTLIFWHWPAGEQRRAARDGMEAYLKSEPPSFKQQAKRPKQEAFDLLLPKFQSILEQGYVVSNQSATEIAELEEFIISYMDYFGVPKADDILVVYNGASCGLNETVWAPKFWLPTPKSATQVLNYNYCGVDLDLGEMFLNSPLPMLFRRLSGINLSPLRTCWVTAIYPIMNSSSAGSVVGWASNPVLTTQLVFTTGLRNLHVETDKTRRILCVGMRQG